jgi:type II secretory pathway component PulJ
MTSLRAMARDDEGITLIETSVSMVVGALVITAMIGFVVGTSRTDDLHQADDAAVQDLRISRELLSRDLRVAEAVTVADARQVTIWLDGDRDDVADVGESVTWTVDPDLGLTRQVDGGIPVPHAAAVVYDESGFRYDSSTLTEITEIQFVLVSAVESAVAGGERSVQTTIHLRNGASG